MTKPGLLKVLYVDDEPINIMVFEARFSKEYEILTAPNGESGLEILSKHLGINIVFSDFQMSGINGLEFIEKARQMYPGLGYFLLTCSMLTPEIETALDTKLINGLIRKPYKKEEIIRVINKGLISQ